MRISSLLSSALLAGVVLLPSVPSASAQTLSLSSLDQALAAGDWQQADAIAARLDAQAGQGDVMAAYAASVRHAGNGQCAEAVILADLVIQAVPFFVPPYLVSYRCHNALGLSDAAAARLSALQAILPEGPERDLISQLLQNEQSRGQPVFGGYFTAAPSTNVNRQTAEEWFLDGGWQIPDEARGQRGVLFSLGGSVAVELARTERLSVSGVLRTDIRYSTADEVFEPSFTAELPLTFRISDTVRAVVAPYVTLGLEESVLDRAEVGVRSTLSLPIDAQQRLALDFRIAAVDRPQTPGRSGMIVDGAVSYATSLASNVNLTTTARAIYNHTDDDWRRTLEATMRARVDTLFDDGLLLGLEGTIGQRWHWQPPPPFISPEDQVDKFVSGRIDASHRDISFGPLMPSVYYQYTNSWSNSLYYTYDSHDIGLTLRASF